MPIQVFFENQDPYHQYFQNVEQAVEVLCNEINAIDFSPGFEKSERTFPTVEQIQPIVEAFNGMYRLAHIKEKAIRNSEEEAAFFNRFKDTLNPFTVALSSRVKDAYIASRRAELALNPEKREMIDFEVYCLNSGNKGYLKALSVILNVARNDTVPRVATDAERRFHQILSSRF